MHKMVVGFCNDLIPFKIDYISESMRINDVLVLVQILRLFNFSNCVSQFLFYMFYLIVCYILLQIMFFWTQLRFNLIGLRDITQIKESEQRARAQAQHLRNALDEHGLELRIKAANEAEAACQKRLSAAEAEIAALRAELDASDRFCF